jgi:hypothetical protein
MNSDEKAASGFLFLVKNEKGKVLTQKVEFLHKYMSKYDSRGLNRCGIEFSIPENPKDQVLTKMKAARMQLKWLQRKRRAKAALSRSTASASRPSLSHSTHTSIHMP